MFRTSRPSSECDLYPVGLSGYLFYWPSLNLSKIALEHMLCLTILSRLPGKRQLKGEMLSHYTIK